MLETRISYHIINSSIDDFLGSLVSQVIIVGGGPSGLVAASFLAEKKINVLLLEKKFSLGGGIWGGGMMYPRIVLGKKAGPILEKFEIKFKTKEGLLIADAIETAAKLTAAAIDRGAKIFNGITVEDVVIRKKSLAGVVVNWTLVNQGEYHIDPIALSSEIVLDATGHPAEVSSLVSRKVGRLKTPKGKIIGEGSMWVDPAESAVVRNAREIFPGLFVSGMAANAVFGSPRMGPIFGGMFLSGKRVAELIVKKIKRR